MRGGIPGDAGYARMDSGSSGIVRGARRPKDWISPGPQPAGAQGRRELLPGANEDLCFLVCIKLCQTFDSSRQVIGVFSNAKMGTGGLWTISLWLGLQQADGMVAFPIL